MKAWLAQPEVHLRHDSIAEVDYAEQSLIGLSTGGGAQLRFQRLNQIAE